MIGPSAIEDRLTEALAHQDATSEILRVISSSPDDIQPVIDVIARSAVRLCDGQFCAVFKYENDLIDVVGLHGMTPEGAAAYRQGFPLRAASSSAIGRAIRSGAVVHIPDVYADPEYRQLGIARAVTFRGIVAVPMMRNGTPVGGIAVSSSRAEPFSDSRIGLLRTFASQAEIAIESARLYATSLDQARRLATAHVQVSELDLRLQTENLRVEGELAVTRRLQLMLLPTAHELQQIDGLDIACHMPAAVEVGGDYYDVLQHEGRVKIGIGDVTGHGLESGVVMLMTQAIMRALLASGETDHVRFLSVLNQAVYGNVQRMGSDKNLSLCLLDYEHGEVRLSGQHEQMIVMRRDAAVEIVDTIDLGFPIGLEDDIAAFVDQATVRLAPDDGVVLYTDGVTEASNMDGEQYGMQRLFEVLKTHWALPAAAIKQAVVRDVARFIGEQTMYDDITLVVAKQR